MEAMRYKREEERIKRLEDAEVSKRHYSIQIFKKKSTAANF